MAKKNSRVKITGQMSPVFISQIARSAPVNRALKSTVDQVKERLEARAKAFTKGRGRFRYHYGMRRRAGSYGWGSTWILWASTKIAKDNPVWFRSAISKTKNISLKKSS